MLSGAPPRAWALVLAAAFATATVFAPRVLGPLARAWFALGDRLHAIVSPVVLGFLFFGIVTPTAWIHRWLSRDGLVLRKPAATDTYWREADPSAKRAGRFLDQF